MKKLVLLAFCMCFWAISPIMAQKEVAIISVVEYTEALDGGNSKMFITMNGKTDEVPLKGLFAIAGYMNEKNIKSNDAIVSKKIADMQKEGWILADVAAVLRSGTNDAQRGMIVTRYILTK
jgi:hypothetical protein